MATLSRIEQVLPDELTIIPETTRKSVKMRYFVFIHEENHFIQIGSTIGYDSLEEAKACAKRSVDDALPRNKIRVMANVATAYLRGDGEPDFENLENPS